MSKPAGNPSLMHQPPDVKFSSHRRAFVAVLVLSLLAAASLLLFRRHPDEPSRRKAFAVVPASNVGGRALLAVPRSSTPKIEATGPKSKINGKKQPPPARVQTDDVHRTLLLGDWSRSNEYGNWSMTVQEEGAGTMIVKPSGGYSLLIGDQVTIEIDWSVKDGYVEFISVRGEPEASFKAVSLLYGKHRRRKILELTEDRLLLLDPKDNDKSLWKRVDANKKTVRNSESE